MSLLHIAKLTGRRIVKVQGPDSYVYLQGLLSNDVRLLYDRSYQSDERLVSLSPNSIGAFMMNHLGRSICDLLIFRTPNTGKTFEFTPPGQAKEPDELYIECDADLGPSLVRTLTAYRVKRKVSFSLEEHLNIFCLYRPIIDHVDQLATKQVPATASLLPQIHHDNEIVSQKYIMTCDPRLADLGLRIVTPEKDFTTMRNELKLPTHIQYEQVPQSRYVDHRYRLGVGEGRKDTLESSTMPLECNADYLRSVSFTKGCYLGQELTARIHHTGVVRKRIMPIALRSDNNKAIKMPPVPGSDIINEDGKNVGKIRHIQGDIGLALMRVEQTMQSKFLRHEQTNLNVDTNVPFWWPAQIEKKDASVGCE